MGFYSFIVNSPDEVPLPEYLIYLDPGRNVFNTTVNDLDAFTKRLAEAGVEILQCNRLDEFEQAEPLDIDLEQDPFDEDPSSPLIVPR